MNKDTFSYDGTIKKTQREILTPYRIAVVMFIKIYCSDNSPKEIAERRDFCVAGLILIQSPDMDKTQLFKLLDSSEFSLTRFSAQLQLGLETICKQGIQELLDLFDSLGSLLKPILIDSPHMAKLNSTSVLGLYIRRAMVTFDKLPFHNVVELFEDMQKYLEPQVVDVNESTDEMDGAEKFFENSNHVWVGKQAELLVAQQAHALLTDEHKALPPSILDFVIERIISSSPYYAEAYYLRYLNFVRIREYLGSIETLYQSFDRLAPLQTSSTIEEKLRTFRYAALNLASLYAQFGHNELAKMALKEAIMLAQEAGDNVCLQLANSWVYYLANEHEKGPLIERSVAKATSLGMWHTASLALIAGAHNMAMGGGEPQDVFLTLTDSDELNNQHSMSDLMSMLYAEKAALWAYYGKTEMSSVCAQLLLLSNSGEKKQLMFNGPSTCQALVTVANLLHDAGEYSFANAVIAHAKERFPNQPSNRTWALGHQLHEFFRLLHTDKLIDAEEVANEIAVVDDMESDFRLVEVYFAKNEFEKAYDLAYKIYENKDITPQQKVRALLAICEVKMASHYGGTHESGAVVILKLCDALQICKDNYLSYYKAIVQMYNVNVQLLIDLPFQALTKIKEPMITILAHGSLFDQGRAHLTYAKVLSANSKSDDPNHTKTMLLEGIEHLKKAKTIFEKLETNDKLKVTLYLLSMFYNEIDNTAERNTYAYEFKQLDQQFPMDKMHLFIF